MPSVETLLVISFAAFLLHLSPGPSNLYVMSRSISQGSTAGLIAASGLALGGLVHVAAAALGLSAIFIYSPAAYLVLKLVGAGYLIYLGFSYLSGGSHQSISNQQVNSKTYLNILQESILIEITNPKTALFFLAFLPQFVDTTAGSPTLQFLVLGTIVTLTAIPCDVFVAVTSDRASRWLWGNTGFRRTQEYLSGCILIGLGAYIALEDKT